MDSLIIPLVVGCAVALLSALGVILARRPVHGAVALLVHSLSIAALFFLLAADMVAVGQIIIYSGAIVVLFLFVVALLPTGGIEGPAAAPRIVTALVGGGALLVAVGAAVAAPLPALTAGPLPGIADIGRALFGPLVVAFELTAPLLLVGIIGAVTIWRRQETEP